MSVNESVKSSLMNSNFIKWIKNNQGIILLSFMIAAFTCFLTYPGILYSDSYHRVNDYPLNLKLAVHSFFHGNVKLVEFDAWLTIIPSFFILACKLLTGSIALYTFLQCFMLFVGTYALGISISQSEHSLWNIIFITLSPVIWAYGVYYEASVGCVIAIEFLILLLWNWQNINTLFDRLLTGVLVFLLSFVCFGYRANAFSVLPAILIIAAIRVRRWKTKFVVFCLIVFGFLSTIIVPQKLNINTMSSYSAGFVWETVSVIQSLEETKQHEYLDFLDDIFGDGETKKAIENSVFREEYSTVGYMFGGASYGEKLSESDHPQKAILKYLQIIKQEPITYLRVKGEFIARTLGLSIPVRLHEYDYNRWGRMEQYGFNDSVPRRAFVDLFHAYMQYMTLFRRPWMMFVIVGIFMLIWRICIKGYKSPFHIYEALYICAVFYYGAFLVNTQSFEFRYFFPSWLLLYLIMISLVPELFFRSAEMKRLALMSLISVFIISIAGIYKEYTQKGSELVKQITTEGRLIFEDESQHVFYHNNYLYFIMNEDGDKEYKYFLHLFPTEGEMVNRDFYYKEHQVPNRFWRNSIAEIEVPVIDLKKIEFGQFYGKTRFWEATANSSDFLDAPKEILVSEYSDSVWNRGYDGGESILVDNISIEQFLLKGKQILSPDGRKALVYDIQKESDRLRIKTEPSLQDVSVRSYKVIQ